MKNATASPGEILESKYSLSRRAGRTKLETTLGGYAKLIPEVENGISDEPDRLSELYKTSPKFLSSFQTPMARVSGMWG